MAEKKPLDLSKVKLENRRPTESTADGIALFNGTKRGEEVLILPDNRKERKFKHTNHIKTVNEKFFDFIEDRKFGTGVALGVTTAIVSYAVYWMMNQ